MATKSFKGRPLLPGNLKGKALASKQPFNTSGSYLENLFAGRKDSAPCTDPNNKELQKRTERRDHLYNRDRRLLSGRCLVDGRGKFGGGAQGNVVLAAHRLRLVCRTVDG